MDKPPPQPPIAADARPAGLFRRFGAGFYDGLLLLAMAMIASFVILLLSGHGPGMASADGRLQVPGPGVRIANGLAVLAITVAYFGYGWRKAGQSLGMKAWRIKVEQEDGRLLQWREVLLRLACAAPFYLLLLMSSAAAMQARPVLAGLLALPMLANAVWVMAARRGALHDLWSGTRVVVTAETRRP